MVAASGTSLRWFRRAFVQQWFAAIGALFSFTTADVTTLISKHGKLTKEAVLNRLVHSSAPVTVATDSVTNINGDKIYSVLLLADGEAWYHSSWSIGKRPDSGIELAHTRISPLIQELRLSGMTVIAFVTDSAPGMIESRREVANVTGVLDIGCAAHLVHNSACHLIDDILLKPVLEPFHQVMVSYLEKRFRNSLDNAGSTKLRRPNTTRWSSMLHCFQSLLNNQAEITAALAENRKPEISADHWLALGDLCRLLRVWEEHNLKVQADNATLLDYFTAISKIHDKLTKLGAVNRSAALTNQFNSVLMRQHVQLFRKAAAYLKGRYDRMEPTSKVLGAVAYICGNRTDMLNSNSEAATHFLQHLAPRIFGNTFTPPRTYTLDLARILGNTLVKQYAELELFNGRWRRNDTDEATSSQLHLLPNPVLYFTRRSRVTECLPLASLMLCLLKVAPSEASVERSFSALKAQWSAARNHLAPETVNDLLQLQLNHTKVREFPHLLQHQPTAEKFSLISPTDSLMTEQDVEEMLALNEAFDA